VALDRQSIEKRDFPKADHGYDPAAVDAHLSALADEVEELKRSTGGRTASLAATASDRIRAIVEGAETSAAEIERQAREDASRIRAEAGTDAAAIRRQAEEHAHADVGKVDESTSGMLARLEAMQAELNSLFESLRTGTERLRSELGRLEGEVGEMKQATGAPESAVGPASLPGSATPVDQAKAAVPAAAEPSVPRAAESAAAWTDDTEGARLVALNMALNGTPREETDKYLAENFSLTDRRGLLDEVYESVEG
jgi:peptidoglycan hydrolase CwlO-like protein